MYFASDGGPPPAFGVREAAAEVGEGCSDHTARHSEEKRDRDEKTHIGAVGAVGAITLGTVTSANAMRASTDDGAGAIRSGGGGEMLGMRSPTLGGAGVSGHDGNHAMAVAGDVTGKARSDKSNVV